MVKPSSESLLHNTMGIAPRRRAPPFAGSGRHKAALTTRIGGVVSRAHSSERSLDDG